MPKVPEAVRGDSNIGTTNVTTQSANHSTGSSNVRTNVSSTSERTNTVQSGNVSVQILQILGQ